MERWPIHVPESSGSSVTLPGSSVVVHINFNHGSLRDILTGPLPSGLPFFTAIKGQSFASPELDKSPIFMNHICTC